MYAHGEIAIGQQWTLNRPDREYTVHVLGILMDKLGKHKIAIQLEYPPKPGIRPNYATAKLVSPQYFYGLTVKVTKFKATPNGQ